MCIYVWIKYDLDRSTTHPKFDHPGLECTSDTELFHGDNKFVVFHKTVQIILMGEIQFLENIFCFSIVMYFFIFVVLRSETNQFATSTFQCTTCIPYTLYSHVFSSEAPFVTFQHDAFLTLTLPGPSAGVSGSLDSYCSLKPLCSGMGEVVPARTSPTLLPPSPRTMLSLTCFKVLQCINCHDWHCKS